MNEFTKPPRVSLLGRQFSEERVAKMEQQAQAAMTVFGGLIGNCYLMAEIVDGEIVECVGKMRKCKWYRHELKKNVKDAWKFLKDSIAVSTTGSITRPSLLRCYADKLSEYLSNDLTILRLAIRTELDKHGMPDLDVLSEMILIEILLQYITLYYDKRKKYMMQKMPLEYDICYAPIRCTKAYEKWKAVVDGFTAGFMGDEYIIITNVKSVDDAFGVLYKKMNSSYVADLIQKAVREEEGDDGNEGTFVAAAEQLGII